MIHSEDVLEDREARFLIVTPPEPNDEFTMKVVVRVLIVDFDHRYKAIVEFRDDICPMFSWYVNPHPVYLTIPRDSHSSSNIEIMNNSKLFSTVYSTALACTKFLRILRSLVAYARIFSEDYSLHFQDATICTYARIWNFQPSYLLHLR